MSPVQPCWAINIGLCCGSVCWPEHVVTGAERNTYTSLGRPQLRREGGRNSFRPSKTHPPPSLRMRSCKIASKREQSEIHSGSAKREQLKACEGELWLSKSDNLRYPFFAPHLCYGVIRHRSGAASKIVFFMRPNLNRTPLISVWLKIGAPSVLPVSGLTTNVGICSPVQSSIRQ